MNPTKPEPPGRSTQRSAGTNDYYPLLLKNDDQTPEKEVLSNDGKTVYPSLPAGERIVRYSEKEQWHYDNCYPVEGYVSRWDALCDIWRTVQDSEEELKSLRKKASRNSVCGDLEEHPPLPPPYGKKICHAHIVLQLFFKYKFDAKIETGASDFWCERCGRPFLLMTALDCHKKGSDSSAAALWLGFEEVERSIVSGRESLTCPVCGEQTYPHFEWRGSTVKAPQLSEEDVLLILSDSFANGMKKLAAPGRKVFGLFGDASLVTTDRNAAFFRSVQLIGENQRAGKYVARKLPYAINTRISGVKAVIELRALEWGHGSLGFEDQRDFNSGVNEIFEQHGIEGFWVEDILD